MSHVMSSTYISPPTADAHAHNSHELVDDLGLINKSHLLNQSFDQSHLSPTPYYSHTVSNQTSPNNFGSTPGESISEHSNYQPSEFSEYGTDPFLGATGDDPFLGVDFDRVGSFPTGLAGNSTLQDPEINHQYQELPQAEPKSASDISTTSTYPISPGHTNPANTPSSRSDVNDLKTRTTISQHELTTELHNSRSPGFTSLAPANFVVTQLTPGHSDSSHASTEGLEPSTMNRPEQAPPHVTIDQWGNDFATRSDGYGTQYIPHRDSNEPHSHDLQDEGPGRVGLDPDQRPDNEGPSPNDLADRRRVAAKNNEVFQWRTQATGGGSNEEQSAPLDALEANNNIPEMTETYFTKNRPQGGQVYHRLVDDDVPKAMADEELLRSRPHQWYDSASLPHIAETKYQPVTSKDAMQQYLQNADRFSIKSRVATWGTDRTLRRRQSEPSLFGGDGVEEIGNYIKTMSIKPEEGERRQSNFIEQQLYRLSSLVRNKSDAGQKRPRPSQNTSQDAQNVAYPRHNSQGSLSLAPPGRSLSFTRRPTPNLNNAIGAMTASFTAVGSAGHTRKESISAGPTSPKSPQTSSFTRAKSVISRVRSGSNLSSQNKETQPGIVGLLRAQGGPPVANLAGSPPLETPPFETPPQPKTLPKQPPPPRMQDEDDDDDDEDEPGDDSDMKIDSAPQTELIIPTYEGFKAHVRHLNPDMLPDYRWLVSRIAYQQEQRYKNLLKSRVEHSKEVGLRNCAARNHCMSLNGRPTLLDAKGMPRDLDRNNSLGLQLVTDFSDDSNPGEGALTDETFPAGVPMPPTKNLPAEFECQLCFKAKKFQKPSDWTKHVHEDVQPFTCTYEKCKESKSFKRKADWVRHENERHRHLEWWVCQIDDCKHPCYRKDNFLQHLVREHKLPEPKQKTKAAIKKSHNTEPAWTMLEICHHETSQKPHEEHCKFCGKTFNTWKKLTVHLAKHMEQISLPILNLVKLKDVDANTIISPIREQILTPITPTSAMKLEPHSPFANDVSYSPLGQPYTQGYEQTGFHPTTGTSPGYGLQAPVSQEVSYDQGPNIYRPNFSVQQHMNQPHVFGSVDNGFHNMIQTRGYGSLNEGFTQPKIDQPRHFGPVDDAFSHGLAEANYNLHPSSGYTMPHNYVSAPAVSSSYHASNNNMLNISQPGFDYNAMAVNGMPQQQQQPQSYQHLPINRAQGSASPYGQSPQNVQNYYSPQQG